MYENRFDETMDEISIANGCNWNDDSKIRLFARFLQEERDPFIYHRFEKFLELQAERNSMMFDFDTDLEKFVGEKMSYEDALAHTIAVAKGQVLDDMNAEVVPRDVKCFGDLHNYVDANYYGNAFDWPSLQGDVSDWGNESAEQHLIADRYLVRHCNFWNSVQDAVHNWLEQGRPT